MSTVFDNQVNWRAIKSIVPGTLIYANGGSHTGTLTIYSVPAGSTFYLAFMYYHCNIENISEGSSVYVADSSDNILWYLAFDSRVVGDTSMGATSFSIPLPVLGTQKIVINSTEAAPESYAQIVGWLE